MIWAVNFDLLKLKYHIDSNYPKKVLINKEEENNSMETSICNFSEKELMSTKFSQLSLLNFDSLRNLSYDSEKESYSSMEDKLKKIKKRFEIIKELK